MRDWPRTHVEPDLQELLHDEVMQALLAYDRLRTDDVLHVVNEVRQALQRNGCFASDSNVGPRYK